MKLIATDADGRVTAAVDYAADCMLTESVDDDGHYVLIIAGPASGADIPEPIRVNRGGSLNVESSAPPTDELQSGEGDTA